MGSIISLLARLFLGSLGVINIFVVGVIGLLMTVTLFGSNKKNK